MATTRTTWKLDNFSGAPGYLNFYMQGQLSSTDLDAAAAAQRTFLIAAANLWPTGVTVACQSTATAFNEVTGALISPLTMATVPALFTGTGGTTYASPAGIVVVWRTARLVVRRLMTGRSFLVPAASIMYGPDGTLADASRATLAAAANTYVNRVTAVSDGRACIWHRNGKNASDGYTAPVIAATVNDRVAMLTSRRSR